MSNVLRLAAALALLAPLVLAQQQPPRFGTFRSAVEKLHQPSAAVFAPDGTIWVAERGSGRCVAVTAVSSVVRASFPVDDPEGLALAPSGELFVSDASEHCVRVFDTKRPEDQKLWRQIGRRGTGSGEFLAPAGLAIRDGKLYVADSKNHRVQVLDLDGQPLAVIGKHGRGDGELSYPSDVDVDSHGDVFVSDLGNQRVVRFDAQGQFVKSWGGLGPYEGLFHSPTGLEIFRDEIYVADRDNHRIQVFDRDGNPVHTWGVHALLPREGKGKLHYPDQIAIAPDGKSALVVEGFEDRVQVFGEEGEAAASTPPLSRETIAHWAGGCDVAGKLFAVVEPSGPSVSIFDLSLGTPAEITRFGRNGPNPGQMLAPVDIEFDASGEAVWISDPGTARLSLFSVKRAPGDTLRYEPFLAQFVRALDVTRINAPSAPWPVEPGALELGPNGNLFVADTANGRVLELDGDGHVVHTFGTWGRERLDVGSGLLLLPSAIAISADGAQVCVLDGQARLIEAYRADGTWSNEIAWMEPRDVRSSPLIGRGSGMTFDTQRSLVVSDEDAHHLLRVALDGRTLAVWGGPGLGRCEFFKPQGVACGPDGRIFVVDHGNHRFQILTPAGEFSDAWGARLFLEPILKSKPAGTGK